MSELMLTLINLPQIDSSGSFNKSNKIYKLNWLNLLIQSFECHLMVKFQNCTFHSF